MTVHFIVPTEFAESAAKLPDLEIGRFEPHYHSWLHRGGPTKRRAVAQSADRAQSGICLEGTILPAGIASSREATAVMNNRRL